MLEPDGYNDARTAIREIYDRHRGRYGYRRITAQLRNDGMHLNHKTVQKLMVEMNLYGKRKTAKYKSYKGEIGTVALNVIDRNFTATAPRDRSQDKGQEDISFSCPGYVQWGDNILHNIISSGPGNGNEDAG